MEIQTNGIKTNYIIIGEGDKSFLFLHGWGSNSEKWINVAEKISQKGFRVIIPDMPGFGKSEMIPVPWDTNKYISWLESFVNQAGLTDFYLAGHSFGGALAAKFSIKHPQDIKKLFLISAACVRKKTAPKSFSANMAKAIRIFSFIPFYNFFRKIFYRVFFRNSDYVYVDGIMKKTYLNVIAEDLSFHLGFIKVATIIIWGDKDRFTPLDDGKLANEKITGSKLEVIPGADHLMHKEIPDLLAQKILENI